MKRTATPTLLAAALAAAALPVAAGTNEVADPGTVVASSRELEANAPAPKVFDYQQTTCSKVEKPKPWNKQIDNPHIVTVQANQDLGSYRLPAGGYPE